MPDVIAQTGHHSAMASLDRIDLFVTQRFPPASDATGSEKRSVCDIRSANPFSLSWRCNSAKSA